MQNGLSPAYLTSLVPDSVGNALPYNLRNNNDIQTIHSNTQLYFNSFLPSSVREWNSLPEDTRNSSSVVCFKRKLTENQRKPPPYYSTGKRQDQIYHTRLRTGCSALNQHLFSKNIVPSPLCVCGVVENTHHFFFDCTLYQNIRHEMLASISNIATPTLQTLLYGNPELSDENNRNIFLTVQSYIRKSKRFKTE